MLLKYIQHYLNDEGMEFFPSWFEETKTLIKNFEGFVTLHYSPDFDDANKMHFYIIFKDQAALERWGKSPEHQHALNKLAPYWQKEWQAKYIEL